MPTRRQVLAGLSATGAGLAIGAAPRSHAAQLDPRRLVVLVLRGGMDGLAAVPALGDPHYEQARAGAGPAADKIIDLDGFFGLHPALSGLQSMWGDKELALVHAASTPDSPRSHFAGQDLLESGGERPGAAHDGWLNRALAALPRDRRDAVALGASVPLVLQGDVPVSSLDPAREPAADDGFLSQVADLYQHDRRLGPPLVHALETRALIQPEGAAGDLRPGNRGPGAWARQLDAAATLLGQPGGPTVAVMDLGGWDTHTAQSRRLSRLLGGLGDSLATLRRSFDSTLWQNTVVVAVSEFGRTAAANGTGGTDHGTGGVMVLAGGAVAGGQVVADWPGMGPADLHEGRDLRPTIDVRTVLGAVLRDHLGVPEAALRRSVFPGAPLDAGLTRLIRA